MVNNLTRKNMKMTFLTIDIIGFILFIACGKTFDEKLTLKREDYTGNELKVNGYYYTFFKETKITAILFLYRNGIVLSEGGFTSYNLEDIERQFNNISLKVKSNWGVFIVNGNTIQYERWIGSTGSRACTSKSTGYIINDTTIHFFERYNSERNEKYSIDETWHFKQFDNKPDSTNNFIP
jgi:hypothetical protein